MTPEERAIDLGKQLFGHRFMENEGDAAHMLLIADAIRAAVAEKQASVNESKTVTAKYLSTSHTARMLGVSTDTLFRWVKQGKFPAPVELSPRCYRFTAESVEAYLTGLPGAEKIRHAH